MSEPNFADLVADVEELKKAYAPIKITTELGEPQRIEKDGSLIFIQAEISTVHYTKEDLNNIMNVIEKIRNKIVA